MFDSAKYFLIAYYILHFPTELHSRRLHTASSVSQSPSRRLATRAAQPRDIDYPWQRNGGSGGSSVDYYYESSPNDDSYDLTSPRTEDPQTMHRCYSCMSREMGQLRVWDALRRTFYRPKAFTDHCDAPFKNASLVPTRVCRTFCVTLKHAVVVMGERTNKIYYMRGCSSSLTMYGFRNQTMHQLDALPAGVCVERSVASLFNARASSSLRFQVTACPCFGDRCNGAASPARPPHFVNAAVGSLLVSAWRPLALRTDWSAAGGLAVMALLVNRRLAVAW